MEATGKGIGPNEFIEFPIVAANPEDEAHLNGKHIKRMITVML